MGEDWILFTYLAAIGAVAFIGCIMLVSLLP
jgi:hypothetical protein